ncbi:hypothetical protein ACOME3_002590 [Neoechinorhynchus agilis]
MNIFSTGTESNMKKRQKRNRATSTMKACPMFCSTRPSEQDDDDSPINIALEVLLKKPSRSQRLRYANAVRQTNAASTGVPSDGFTTCLMHQFCCMPEYSSVSSSSEDEEMVTLAKCRNEEPLNPKKKPEECAIDGEMNTEVKEKEMQMEEQLPEKSSNIE